MGLVARARFPSELVAGLHRVLESHPRWPLELEAVASSLERFDMPSIRWLAEHNHPAFDATARRWAQQTAEPLQSACSVEWALAQASGEQAPYEAAFVACLDDGFRRRDGSALGSTMADLMENFPERVDAVLIRLVKELPRDELPEVLWEVDGIYGRFDALPEVIHWAMRRVEEDVRKTFERWLRQHDASGWDRCPLSPSLVTRLRELGAIYRPPEGPALLEGAPVPEAIYALAVGVDFGRAAFENDESCWPRVWSLEMGMWQRLDPEEYPLGDGGDRPFAVIGHADGGNYFLLVALDSPNPSRPLIGRIDHYAPGQSVDLVSLDWLLSSLRVARTW